MNQLFLILLINVDHRRFNLITMKYSPKIPTLVIEAVVLDSDTTDTTLWILLLLSVLTAGVDFFVLLRNSFCSAESVAIVKVLTLTLSLKVCDQLLTNDTLIHAQEVNV